MSTTIKFVASEHPIKGVTVYSKSSQAEVVRTFQLNLKAGSNKVHITSLPSTIDKESVRISGLTKDARLTDVVCTTNVPSVFGKSSIPKASKQSDALRALVKKKLELESERGVYQCEADFLVSYGRSLQSEHVTPKDFEAFLKSFVDQGKRNSEHVHQINTKIEELEKLIEEEEKKENDDHSDVAKVGTQHGQVWVTLVTDSDVKAEMKITYMVSNASWEPAYELHASTESGSGKPSKTISLYYRGKVTQGTGEDWSNTQLTLSTVSVDSFVKSIPVLSPVKIVPQSGKGFTPKPTGFFPQQAQQMTKGIQQVQQQQPGSIFQNQQSNVGLFNGFSLNQAPQPNTLFTGATLFGSSSGQPNVEPQPVQPQTQLFGTSVPSAFTSASTESRSLFGSSSNPTIEESFEDLGYPPADPATSNAGDGEQNDGTSRDATVVTETPFSITYSVEGKSSIPSDDVPHQVEVVRLDFESKVEYVVVPSKDARVLLQCQVKNTSEYRLLPGPVTVLLDDGFVSKTSIKDVNTNDTFTCTLGADSGTLVRYVRSSRTVRSAGGAFAEVHNITTFTRKIIIHNKHPFALTDVYVRDVVPVGGDNRVKVLLRKPEGLADAKDGEVISLKDGSKVMWSTVGSDGTGGEKEGKFEWKWNVEGGAQVVLQAEWDVKAPADLALSESFAKLRSS